MSSSIPTSSLRGEARPRHISSAFRDFQQGVLLAASVIMLRNRETTATEAKTQLRSPQPRVPHVARSRCADSGGKGQRAQSTPQCNAHPRRIPAWVACERGRTATLGAGGSRGKRAACREVEEWAPGNPPDPPCRGPRVAAAPPRDCAVAVRLLERTRRPDDSRQRIQRRCACGAARWALLSRAPAYA
jgi:hypothetical protein